MIAGGGVEACWCLLSYFCSGPQWSIARITEPDINILEKHGGREQKLDQELNIRIKVRQVMCGRLANNMFV